MRAFSYKDIKDLRDDYLMTQEEFAAEVGVTVGTISEWERALATPQRGNLRRLIELKQRYDSHAANADDQA